VGQGLPVGQGEGDDGSPARCSDGSVVENGGVRWWRWCSSGQRRWWCSPAAPWSRGGGEAHGKSTLGWPGMKLTEERRSTAVGGFKSSLGSGTPVSGGGWEVKGSVEAMICSRLGGGKRTGVERR
jgi:hypothetical protein